MTAVATAWAVEGSNGRKFRLAREHDENVKITWLCGDVVNFEYDELEEAVANLELLAPHGVWLRFDLDSGDNFVARVVDGELQAAANPNDAPGEHVAWEHVRELVAPEPPPPVVAEEPIVEPAPVYSYTPAPSTGTRVKSWLRTRAGR